MTPSSVKAAVELVESEKLAVVLGRPAEQAEEVDESLGQKAGIAIGGDADDGAVLALGELGAIGGDEQGEMRELGRLDAEGLEDQQVLEGVGEVILAADDVADAQIGVVDAGGEMVGGHAVRAQQREVFHLVGELGLRAVDAIGKAQGAALAARNAIAEGERLAGSGAAVAFFARQFAHAGIEEPGALRGGLVAVARVGRGEVAIGKALGEDGFGLLAVQGEPFGLLVLFVPGETQPAQSLEDGLDAGVGVALDIGVVEAQHHGSVVVAGVEPIEDKGAGAADVQKAGGRGRKTNARSSSL